MRLIETHFSVDVATPQEQLNALHDSIFEKFDYDHSSTVHLGSCPIQMVIEDNANSFVKEAAKPLAPTIVAKIAKLPI